MGKIKERNREIIRKHGEGVPAGVLASEYGLREKTVTDIVQRARQQSKDPGRDRFMDDADRKRRAIEKLRRIRVGDVLRVSHEMVDAYGYRYQGLFSGTVIYRDENLVTVRGDFYTESFQLFDLSMNLLEHIPS